MWTIKCGVCMCFCVCDVTTRKSETGERERERAEREREKEREKERGMTDCPLWKISAPFLPFAANGVQSGAHVRRTFHCCCNNSSHSDNNTAATTTETHAIVDRVQSKKNPGPFVILLSLLSPPNFFLSLSA